jgi:hypothetical protein
MRCSLVPTGIMLASVRLCFAAVKRKSGKEKVAG